MKYFKLTESQFTILMSKALSERNENIKKINGLKDVANNLELVNYYQNEVNKSNLFFDELNAKFKTDF